MSGNGLAGLTVLAFESRRAVEMAELIRRHGGTPLVAPAMREVPLEDNHAAFEFVERLERGEIDLVILLTGVGTRTLVAAVASRYAREQVAALLARCTVLARGPKPVAALRELGLAPALLAPEPNTWREVLALLDRAYPVRGRRVVVQEYGQSNPELLAGLRQRGADVSVVPVYRWALPEDTGPLRDAIAALIADRVQVALFTSATQVDHLFSFAEQCGVDAPALRGAFDRVVIASIGPVCSEALAARGLHPDIEPVHPKMGHLLACVAERAPALARTKPGVPAH
jgi:uroporphyrinogen-III synthase